MKKPRLSRGFFLVKLARFELADVLFQLHVTEGIVVTAGIKSVLLFGQHVLV